MDPASITVAALAFAGSCIAQKCADAGIEAAWERMSAAYKRWRGDEPRARVILDLDPDTVADSAVIREAESIFGLSSALRRARQVDAVLRGARILWVDDHPENNVWERSLLKAFGTETVSVETTRSAVGVLQRERFDVILSDIVREGR